MEFDELQTLWQSQNDDNLYTIDEEALHARIQEKSESVDYKLNLFERLMFFGNLIVGLVLLFDAVFENAAAYEYVLPALYILFSISILFLRRSRKQEEVQFELTIVGELDKALWQINTLIRRARSMMFWYVLPLAVVITVTLLLNAKPFWALGMLLVLGPLSYFGGRWEVNKWYMPKKLELEALREELQSSR